MENWIWLLFLIFPLFIGLLIYFNYRAEKARREALQEASQRLILNLSPDGDADFLNRLGPFTLAAQGRSRRLTNLMRGRHGDLEVALFDYRYTTGSGKHSRTHRQTAVLFAGESSALTRFSLANFGDGWGGEIAHSVGREHAGCHLALAKDGSLLGFAAYGSSRPSWFGPMGTAPAARGLGIGALLLRRCLADQRAAGQAQVQIGWVGPLPFYAKAVGARVERVFLLYRKQL